MPIAAQRLLALLVAVVPVGVSTAQEVRTERAQLSVPPSPPRGASCARFDDAIRRVARRSCMRVRGDTPRLLSDSARRWSPCKVTVALPRTWEGHSCPALAKWSARPFR